MIGAILKAASPVYQARIVVENREALEMLNGLVSTAPMI
jgi:hypothetical protein